MQICRSHPTFIRLSLRDFKWGHESKVFTFECPVLNSSQFILGKPNYGHIVISTCYLKKIANLQQHPISFPITASGCFSMLLIFFLAINRLETSYPPQHRVIQEKRIPSEKPVLYILFLLPHQRSN